MNQSGNGGLTHTRIRWRRAQAPFLLLRNDTRIVLVQPTDSAMPLACICTGCYKGEVLFPNRKQSSLLAGFTLAELLVVVLVIGVLAGLLYTAVSKAKAKSRSAACVNNLRQHGVALSQFLGDHHSYPLAFSDRSFERTADRYISWMDALFPKTSTDTATPNGVFNCPAASKPSTFDMTTGFTDYGYNAWGLNGPGKRPLLGIGGDGPIFVPDPKAGALRGDYYPPVAEAEVRNPSDLLAIGDGFIGWNDVIEDGKFYLGRTSSANDNGGSSGRAPKRHSKSAKMLFADGHVASLTLKFLFTDTDDAALQIWNRDNDPHRDRLKE